MEKEEYKSANEEKCIHHFYCDCCNKYLGFSNEYDDGYYNKIGEFERNFYLESIGWLKLSKCLCKDCRKKFDDKIINILKELGFEKEV